MSVAKFLPYHLPILCFSYLLFIPFTVHHQIYWNATELALFAILKSNERHLLLSPVVLNSPWFYRAEFSSIREHIDWRVGCLFYPCSLICTARDVLFRSFLTSFLPIPVRNLVLEGFLVLELVSELSCLDNHRIWSSPSSTPAGSWPICHLYYSTHSLNVALWRLF